jgi:hypothetical protein
MVPAEICGPSLATKYLDPERELETNDSDVAPAGLAGNLRQMLLPGGFGYLSPRLGVLPDCFLVGPQECTEAGHHDRDQDDDRDDVKDQPNH